MIEPEVEIKTEPDEADIVKNEPQSEYEMVYNKVTVKTETYYDIVKRSQVQRAKWLMVIW